MDDIEEKEQNKEQNKDKNQNDYLNQFISDTTNTNNYEELSSEISEIKNKMPITTNNLDYLNVDLNALPLGGFYKNGFKLKIRAAKVNEVQAYSVVDDNNYLDVTEKMNHLLSSCVRVELSNGKNGSYKDIKDGDRLPLVFMIRELTFQNGNSLSKETQCEYCSHEFQIPFRATTNAKQPRTFERHEMPEELDNFYDEYERCFIFNIEGANYKLTPPTIGMQEVIYKYIKETVEKKKTPNVSFLKIIPFLMGDRIYITDDGIKSKEDEFKRFDMTTFQILNHAVDKMVFGIKGLKMKCPECGQEVHTDMTFPNGASSLFVVSNPLTYFDKK